MPAAPRTLSLPEGADRSSVPSDHGEPDYRAHSYDIAEEELDDEPDNVVGRCAIAAPIWYPLHADAATAADSLPDPLPPFSSHLFPSLRGGQQSRSGGARRDTGERGMGKFLPSF